MPGGASRLAALLVAYIFPICSLLAPCQPGAALRQIVTVLRIRDTSAMARRLPSVGRLGSYAAALGAVAAATAITALSAPWLGPTLSLSFCPATVVSAL